MNLIELQNDLKQEPQKKLQEKNKNINDQNGGTVTRVVRRRSKRIAAKEKEKAKFVSDGKRNGDGTKVLDSKKRRVSAQKRQFQFEKQQLVYVFVSGKKNFCENGQP